MLRSPEQPTQSYHLTQLDSRSDDLEECFKNEPRSNLFQKLRKFGVPLEFD